MNGLTTLVLVSVLSGSPESGFASFQLDPELALCIRACVQNNGSCPLRANPKRPHECNAQKAANANTALQLGRRLQAQLASAQQKITSLERSRARGKGNTASVMRTLITLMTSVSAVQDQVNLLGEWLANLSIRENQGYLELQEQVKALERRLDALRPNTFGGNVSFIMLNSEDGTRYTAGGASLKLQLPLYESTAWYVEGGMLAAATEVQPLGAQLRSGLAVSIDSVDLEFGLSGTFAGLNNRVLAKSLFITPEAGVSLRFCGNWYVSGRVMLGVEIDQKKPGFAGGGQVAFGAQF